MPIYEYQCQKCGSHLEVMQKLSDAPLKRCAQCKGKLEKILSRTSFQFKGSGWYVTDYARPSASGNGEKKAEKKEKTAEKSEKTADKKPETSSTSGTKGSSASESV